MHNFLPLSLSCRRALPITFSHFGPSVSLSLHPALTYILHIHHLGARDRVSTASCGTGDCIMARISYGCPTTCTFLPVPKVTSALMNSLQSPPGARSIPTHAFKRSPVRWRLGELGEEGLWGEEGLLGGCSGSPSASLRAEGRALSNSATSWEWGGGACTTRSVGGSAHNAAQKQFEALGVDGRALSNSATS